MLAPLLRRGQGEEQCKSIANANQLKLYSTHNPSQISPFGGGQGEGQCKSIANANQLILYSTHNPSQIPPSEGNGANIKD